MRRRRSIGSTALLAARLGVSTVFALAGLMFVFSGSAGAAVATPLVSTATSDSGGGTVGNGTVLNVTFNETPVLAGSYSLTLTDGSHSCVIGCWGATIGGRLVVARSGLGITAAGELVWAGGENLSVRALAEALLGAGVVRAVELDVNPDWVASYIFQHASGTVAAIPMATGQLGINGQLIHRRRLARLLHRARPLTAALSGRGLPGAGV
jgi:hypothetical protein